MRSGTKPKASEQHTVKTKPDSNHTSQNFLYFTFLSRKKGYRSVEFALCSCNEGTRVSKLNHLEMFYNVPFMSPQELYQSTSHRLYSILYCFCRTEPLEVKSHWKLQEFRRALLNLPQTFVEELKGINRRNSSVGRFN